MASGYETLETSAYSPHLKREVPAGNHYEDLAAQQQATQNAVVSRRTTYLVTLLSWMKCNPGYVVFCDDKSACNSQEPEVFAWPI